MRTALLLSLLLTVFIVGVLAAAIDLEQAKQHFIERGNARRQSAKRAVASFLEKNADVDASTLDPVILIPGLGGSGLEARLNRQDTPAWYCSSKYGWYNLWLDIEEIIAQACFLSNLEITYHPNNNTYSNAEGVEIRAYDWGGLDGVNCLDVHDGSWLCSASSYFEPVSAALQGIGYRAGVNLFGAPYDWRVPSNYLYTQQWEQALTQLIQNASASNGGRRVHLITHSLGGPTTLYFLNRATEAWKDQYVASFIPIAGPWSGATQSLRAALSGENFGLEVWGFSFINLDQIALIARQSGGVLQLMPDNDFYNPNYVFVTTPSKVYSVGNFSQLFTDMGLSTSTLPLYQNVEFLIDQMVHPQVPSYCLYGYGVETPSGLVYSSEFTANQVQQPSQVLTDNFGDGTVPLESLQECRNWYTTTNDPTACREYNLEEHLGILGDADMINDVLKIVTGTFGVLTCDSTDTPVLESYMKTHTSKFTKSPHRMNKAN